MEQEPKYDGGQKNDNRPGFVYTNPYLVQIMYGLLQTPKNVVVFMTLGDMVAQGTTAELISIIQGMIYAEACLAGLGGTQGQLK